MSRTQTTERKSRRVHKPKKSAAILTIKKPGVMTEDGLNEIVRWLRRNATFLKKYGPKGFSKMGPFTARYLYE